MMIGIEVKRVKTTKSLGLIIDESLSWEAQAQAGEIEPERTLP